MASFVLPEKRATIELEDGDFAGAEITVRLRVPFGVLKEISSTASDPAGIERLGELFCEWALVDWNLADHRGPIPATPEGFARLDLDTVGAVLAAWIGGVVEPPAPLPQPSSNGARSRGRKASRSRRS